MRILFSHKGTKKWTKQVIWTTFLLIKALGTKKLIGFLLKMRLCSRDFKIGPLTIMFKAGKRKENLILRELSKFVCIHQVSVRAKEGL